MKRFKEQCDSNKSNDIQPVFRAIIRASDKCMVGITYRIQTLISCVHCMLSKRIYGVSLRVGLL